MTKISQRAAYINHNLTFRQSQYIVIKQGVLNYSTWSNLECRLNLSMFRFSNCVGSFLFHPSENREPVTNLVKTKLSLNLVIKTELKGVLAQRISWWLLYVASNKTRWTTKKLERRQIPALASFKWDESYTCWREPFTKFTWGNISRVQYWSCWNFCMKRYL